MNVIPQTSVNPSSKTSRWFKFERSFKSELLMLAIIFVVGFTSRFLLSDVPNFKPVAALAMFGGFYFQRSTLAVLGLMAMMMVSDFFIGGYPISIALSVYVSLGLGVWLGRRLQTGNTRQRLAHYRSVASGSVLMAVVFFLLTNFAVWGVWYPATWEGLQACYTSAIPFFKYTIAGNLFFSIAAFGIYDVVMEIRAGDPISDSCAVPHSGIN